MPRRDPERLKKYLEMITRKHGGIEKELAERPAGTVPGGLESTQEGPLGMPTTDAADLARSGLEKVARGQTPTEPEQFGLEAIILPKLRPVDRHPRWQICLFTHTLCGRTCRPRPGYPQPPGSGDPFDWPHRVAGVNRP